MLIELLLGIIALITSAIAGVIGFGGGMLLIAIMPMFLPASIIIPVHGLTQLASNASRMVFSLGYVRWEFLPRFLVGSVIGMVLVGYVLINVPMDYVPAAIGLYLLLNLWSKSFSRFISRFENYYLIGFLQTGLGLVVGATGPLSLSVLTKQLSSKDEIIATSSLFMSISHLAKIPVYGVLAFNILDEIGLLTFMVVGSVLGSFIGTKLRLKANNDKLIQSIKILLTLLALKMIVAVVFSTY
ncbi:sulfite exporter TauE/SafE family protein [Bacterioplanoides sp. SCSIO 12839]|uniref:sulfite exporter TauE/SafE family protein n=1 Tax=Bacterioplanoides sp. SCSIO 12839 TaxID=2829569 RepID=UPI00210327CD|nr:sulfite exporter TauE/SafE family protein [Bacterioplanoides sp. SCSIO 12839]UTW49718.1 sulfite exporter TauE/SafE family protein [Bacterioplanoides sp. SCSIO 12839]